jgi:hypothetical protein
MPENAMMPEGESTRPVRPQIARLLDAETRGRWSNGDPVHLILTFGGKFRRVAPNRNGATWVPDETEA